MRNVNRATLWRGTGRCTAKIASILAEVGRRASSKVVACSIYTVYLENFRPAFPSHLPSPPIFLALVRKWSKRKEVAPLPNSSYHHEIIPSRWSIDSKIKDSSSSSSSILRSSRIPWLLVARSFGEKNREARDKISFSCIFFIYRASLAIQREGDMKRETRTINPRCVNALMTIMISRWRTANTALRVSRKNILPRSRFLPYNVSPPPYRYSSRIYLYTSSVKLSYSFDRGN